MKIAFANWNDRIAPVFDTASQIRIVEVEAGRILSEFQANILEELPIQRALKLVELGVSTLVCGAISRPLHCILMAYGIDVIPFVAGETATVVKAWLRGDLERETFAMPGCRTRMRRRRMCGRRRMV